MTLSSDNTFDTPDSGAAPQRPRRLLPWLIAGLVALLAVLYLLPVTVSGVVRNAAGAALPDVRIDLGNGQSTQSDANGAFAAQLKAETPTGKRGRSSLSALAGRGPLRLAASRPCCVACRWGPHPTPGRKAW